MALLIPKEGENVSGAEKRLRKCNLKEEVLHLLIYLSFGDPKSVHFPYITT
jgi:hypothetical protein